MIERIVSPFIVQCVELKMLSATTFSHKVLVDLFKKFEIKPRLLLNFIVRYSYYVGIPIKQLVSF